VRHCLIRVSQGHSLTCHLDSCWQLHSNCNILWKETLINGDTAINREVCQHIKGLMFRGHNMSHNSMDILGKGCRPKFSCDMVKWSTDKRATHWHFLAFAHLLTSNDSYTATCKFKYSLIVKAHSAHAGASEAYEGECSCYPQISATSSLSYGSWACIQQRGQSLTCTDLAHTFVHVSWCMTRDGGRQPI